MVSAWDFFDNEKVRLSILRNEYDEDHTKKQGI